MREPKESSGSESSSLFFLSGAACFGAAFAASAGGVDGGVGGVACFLVSKEPTFSFGAYFLRIPSLTG